MNRFTLNLCDAHMLIIEEIERGATQKDIAKTYALGLRSKEPTDWATANKAIIERWSVSGLERIKNLAWSGKAFDEPHTVED